MDDSDVFLAKAKESLAGAESELANGRFNNCVNRCYYACYQGAVAALTQAGIRPSGGRDAWSHKGVQAEFVGKLVNRRKVYPSNVRAVLAELMVLRQRADYKVTHISDAQARHATRRSREFLAVVRKGAGNRS